MKNGIQGLGLAALVTLLAVAAPVQAARRTVHRQAEPQTMSPVRAQSDDKCDATCDAESDKCMNQAGKDSSKQHQCDASYDDCLRKCQG